MKMEDSNFVDALRNQNNLEIKQIKVIRQYEVKRRASTHFNAVIEVDLDSFPNLISRGKVNIGWERCRIFDGTRVLCCFKCKGFNHRSENCSEKEVCIKCHGEHRTDSCSLPPQNKCINCIRANKKLNLCLDINHSTLDRSCPGYQNS